MDECIKNFLRLQHGVCQNCCRVLFYNHSIVFILVGLKALPTSLQAEISALLRFIVGITFISRSLCTKFITGVCVVYSDTYGYR